MKYIYAKTQILLKTKNFMSSLKKFWRQITCLKLLLVAVAFCILLLSNTVFIPYALAMNIPADTVNGGKILKLIALVVTSTVEYY